MHPRALPILAALSLVLCVATLALWVRSYWRGDTLSRLVSRIEADQLQVDAIQVRAGAGGVSVFLLSEHRAFLGPGAKYANVEARAPEWRWAVQSSPRYPQSSQSEVHFGFAYGRLAETTQQNAETFARARSTLIVPFAALIVVLLVLPVLWFRRRRRRGGRGFPVEAAMPQP